MELEKLLEEVLDLQNSGYGTDEIGVLFEEILDCIEEECENKSVNDEEIKKIINSFLSYLRSKETNLADVEQLKSAVKEELITDGYLLSDVITEEIDVEKINVDKKQFEKKLIEYIIKYHFNQDKITKRNLLDYILYKNGIHSSNLFDSNVDDYFKGDFEPLNFEVEFFSDFFTNLHVNLTYEDLEEIIEDVNGENFQEFDSYEYAKLLDACRNMLTKRKETTEENSLFEQYLTMLLNGLPNYDSVFQKNVIPEFENDDLLPFAVECLGNKLYGFDLYSVFQKFTELKQRILREYLDMKIKELTGMFAYSDVMLCLSDEFKDKLYSGYGNIEKNPKENTYAKLLSKVIAKYCVKKDGETKYNPNEVQLMLLNSYRQILSRLSDMYTSEGRKNKK